MVNLMMSIQSSLRDLTPVWRSGDSETQKNAVQCGSEWSAVPTRPHGNEAARHSKAPRNLHWDEDEVKKTGDITEMAEEVPSISPLSSCPINSLLSVYGQSCL